MCYKEIYSDCGICIDYGIDCYGNGSLCRCFRGNGKEEKLYEISIFNAVM